MQHDDESCLLLEKHDAVRVDGDDVCLWSWWGSCDHEP